MLDIRQGALSVALDPFSTASERCVAGILDPVAPLVGPPITGPHPHLIADRGYINTWSSARAYYLADDGWRDTETDAPWPGALAETFAATWRAKFDLREVPSC